MSFLGVEYVYGCSVQFYFDTELIIGIVILELVLLRWDWNWCA